MLTEERHNLIAEKLASDGRVVAAALATEFGVSEDTVRRDLRELARLGLCRRVYGGALLPAPDPGSLAERQTLGAAQKAALGAKAASLIRAGQTLFVDAGSTNVAVARALPRDLDVTVITNAPHVALALDGSVARTILVGGTFVPEKGACLGSQTLRDIQRIRADVLVLGTCGVDPRLGVTALDAEEAEIKRAMVEQSGAIIAIATSDKLSTVAPFGVAGTADLDHLVVEADAPRATLKAFRAKGVTVHVA